MVARLHKHRNFMKYTNYDATIVDTRATKRSLSFLHAYLGISKKHLTENAWPVSGSDWDSYRGLHCITEICC